MDQAGWVSSLWPGQAAEHGAGNHHAAGNASSASQAMPAAARVMPAVSGATFPCSSTEQRAMDQSMSKPIFLPHVQGKKPSSESARGTGSTGDAPRCPSERGALSMRSPAGSSRVPGAAVAVCPDHACFLPSFLFVSSPPLTCPLGASCRCAASPLPPPPACVLHALLPFLVSSSMRYPKPSHLPSLPDSTDQPPLV